VSGARKAAVAGLFYPADPDKLRSAVGSTLQVDVPADEPAPKAIIAPHAGYQYSGPTAGVVYARLRPLRGRIERVVLAGPAHRAFVDGVAVSSADAFATPLGDVPVDDELRHRVLVHPAVVVDDRAHLGEHSLEVQLPFLLETLGRFTLLPLAVGDAHPDDVAEVLDLVWGGDETLVVVSSDLSHYHDYATAQALDARTAAAIAAGDGHAIADDDACGARPIRGLLLAARRHALGVRQLDLRNSGDTAGDRERVVGYGAFALSARAPD
jgi:AmmeMemoRadiSam system protein B